jgi:hypothetical protein
VRARARGTRPRLEPPCGDPSLRAWFYNAGTMRSFGAATCSPRPARRASLVAATFRLRLGIFLSWPAAGPEITTARTMAGSLHVDRGYGGGGHQMDVRCLAAASDQVDDSSKAPVNAGLLTALSCSRLDSRRPSGGCSRPARGRRCLAPGVSLSNCRR